MPKMTKAQHAKLDKLNARLNRAGDAVYAVMHPRRDVRFSDCYAASPIDVRTAYDAARSDLTSFEVEMVMAGRAWRASHGFVPNS